jgi:hypothetical protein
MKKTSRFWEVVHLTPSLGNDTMSPLEYGALPRIVLMVAVGAAAICYQSIRGA